MKTGDIIYTKIAKMGNKVRPCIAICGNSLKELFLIPISSKDWNTLSTVSICFKGKQGTAVLNESFSQIIKALSNNEKIELRGFGTFSVKHRLPKKARNPKTGDPIFLPERYVPVFKPSKLMKKTVNEKLIEY